MEVAFVQYLMIDEDGTAAVLDHLTPEDLHCIGAGITTVLKIGGRKVKKD